MKISQLNRKTFLSQDAESTDNSDLVVNYAKTNVDPDVTTYRVTLAELGRHLIDRLHLVQYEKDTQNDTIKLKTLSAGTNAYENVQLNEIQNTLNEADSAADNTKFVKKVTQTNGKIAVVHDTFSPVMTWNNATTTNVKPTLQITVAGNTATAVTPNEATTTLYGITKLSNAINSTAENTAATSKAVKDAIESLDITQISNTAGKTVATISEQNGKVGATFQDISILSNQISDRGTAGCVATLDAEGHVPASQLPSYVDDVLEGTVATFPATGESGKIYVDTATNTSYRWSGTQYTKIASDLSLGETSATAYRGDYGAAAYAHAVTNKGIAVASGLYKITTNAEGHITATAAVTSTDITSIETDPTVPAWAKASTKPSYSVNEITGAAPLASPVFTNQITIGSTALTEAQLSGLLALADIEGVSF